jgi:hypothetical protein
MTKIIKTYVASGACTHRRLAKATATDGVVAQASGPTDAIIGVFDFPNGAADGERVDVVLFGIADVEFGGTVAPGVNITADASGKAVAAAPAAGVNNKTAGRTLYNQASGDFGRAFVNPGDVQG